jgi:hypothetical protein
MVLSSCQLQIPAKSSVDVDITWNPTETGAFSDSIQVVDSKGRKAAIALAFSSIAKPLLKVYSF